MNESDILSIFSRASCFWCFCLEGGGATCQRLNVVSTVAIEVIDFRLMGKTQVVDELAEQGAGSAVLWRQSLIALCFAELLQSGEQVGGRLCLD